jgi:hypothetical protein
MALTTTALTIDQGADYVHEWQWIAEDDEGVQTPRDLTDWIGRMHVREAMSSLSTLTEAHTDGNAEGLITLNDDGVVRVEFPHSVSTAWTWGSGVYDIELIDPDGGVTRFTEGRITVRREVTRGT